MKHPYIALVSLLLLPSLACAATYQWKDQDGNTVKLADFTGRRVFVYFYPKANTSG